MGQVFKALHRRMERVVAIKMLPPAMTKDAAAAARFQREVVAAAKLCHPNIVSAYDADQANGVHFLVMEYVEGKDLSAMVKKRRSVPGRQGRQLHPASCSWLGVRPQEGRRASGHQAGQPAARTTRAWSRFSTWGWPASNRPATAQAELTGTGAVMGTVDYMSSRAGIQHEARRCPGRHLQPGLFALLSASLAKPTYGGETVVEKILAHRDQPIPALRDVKPEMPEQVEAVFKKMVAKKIEDRYQTMTEVVAELEKCQAAMTLRRAVPREFGNRQRIPTRNRICRCCGSIRSWPASTTATIRLLRRSRKRRNHARSRPRQEPGRQIDQAARCGAWCRRVPDRAAGRDLHLQERQG